MSEPNNPRTRERVYYPSPMPILLAAVFSAVFTAVQLRRLWFGEPIAGTDLWIFLFTCAADILLFAQVFGALAYLKITRDGFEYRRLYQFYKLSWWDVSEFRLASDARGFIGDKGTIVFDSEKHRPGPLRHLSKLATGGHEQILAYGRSPQELVSALNAARHAALSSREGRPAATLQRPLVA